MGNKLPATIEATPKQISASDSIDTLFPKGTWVYLADVGTDDSATIVSAARRLNENGYCAVPHLPARRMVSKEALGLHVGNLASEAGVDNVLVIAGEADTQMGPYSSSIDVLQSGILDQNGIKKIGFAGHPEGSTVMSDDLVWETLKSKADFANHTDAEMRIVTQFGFDAAQFTAWANDLPQKGISLPIHLGMAGPSKMTTLLKYAAMCGVGPSLGFLKKRAGALASLALNYDPEKIITEIEQAISSSENSPIVSAHIFPFGGLKKSSEWLTQRGSWSSTTS